MTLRPGTKPVVYVVQEDGKKNMTSALDYGSIELVLHEKDEATMLNIPRIVDKIKYGLRNFKKGDYLILIGSPVAIGIACAVASEKTGGEFNCLKWDQQERRYWEAKVNLNQSGA
jgi:hypothetical protein